MVAIKAAHLKLHAKDLWPGLPWTWEQELEIRDMLKQELIDKGITEHPELYFAEGRSWETYMQQFPKYGERQKIVAAIYPAKTKKAPTIFTEEELDYIYERLEGSNDPVGQSVLLKIADRNRSS